MEVSDQLHVPAALPSGERAPGNHWIGGWLGPRIRLDERKNNKNHKSNLLLLIGTATFWLPRGPHSCKSGPADIAQKFIKVSMCLIVNWCIRMLVFGGDVFGTFIVGLHLKCHMSACSDLLVIVIKLNSRYTFRVATMLFLYSTKVCHYFWSCYHTEFHDIP
jgi:hypothetical protein